MPRFKRKPRFESLENRLALAATGVGDLFRVNDLVVSDQATAGSSSSVAVSSVGSVVVFEGRGPVDRHGVFAELLGTTGSTTRATFQVNETTRGDQVGPAVATAANGSFVVVWSGRGVGDKEGVFLRRYSASGVALGGEQLVNQTLSGAQSEAAIAMAADGSFAVAWSGAGAGDSTGVFLRRYSAAGVALNGEARVSTFVGEKSAPSLAFDNNGSLLVVWQSRQQDRSDWGVFGRWYTAAGAQSGVEFRVNTPTAGSQSKPTATNDPTGGVVVAWQSYGQDGDGWSVVGRRVVNGGASGAEVQLNASTAGHQRDVSIAVASDGRWLAGWTTGAPNGAGWEAALRTFGPAGANPSAQQTLGPTGQNSAHQDGVAVAARGAAATAAWSGSGAQDRRGVYGQRYTIDGVSTEPQRSPNLATIANRSAVVGTQIEVTVTATDPNVGDTLTFHLDPSNAPSTARIEQVGPRTAVIRWTPTAVDANQNVLFRVVVTDNGVESLADSEDFTVNVGTSQPANLVGFAQALAATTTRLYGASWNAASSQQRALFQDGARLLPFVESTNNDRTPNQAARDNNVTTYPTWVFPDGSRATEVLTLQQISQRSGVAIPVSTTPTLAAIADSTLLVGSPLHVSLDGYDPGGGLLTYSVTSDNPNVTAAILAGNRSARVSVAGFGEMVFELFEQEASRATARMIALAGQDFYEDIIFHRVINNFVIQGGDPTGTGSGGSTLGDFDDQFDPDLQHNRSGLLSIAKSTDDTNDSQFFITEGNNTNDLRGLDFNHTVFGVLVEGEAVREAISNTAVTGPASSPRPVTPIVMEGIDIFDDQENGVLRLTAAPGATGTANITVTVRDADGNQSQRVFRVTLAPDTSNGRPYLGDVAALTAPRNTTASQQLTSTDVEGDAVFYSVQRVGSTTFTATVSATGLLQVTPPTDFVGTLEVIVGVGRSSTTPDDTQRVRVTFT
ncbi:MAG: peptidylprolyl isomerase [Lacipirellulaceae bacterium]